MNKKQIQVAGQFIIQLTETEYEGENKEQGLDFYFNMEHPNAIEVFVFDSTIPTRGKQDPCIKEFYAADLEEAVAKAMALTKKSVKETTDYIQEIELLQ